MHDSFERPLASKEASTSLALNSNTDLQQRPLFEFCKFHQLAFCSNSSSLAFTGHIKRAGQWSDLFSGHNAPG
jgi:hypothetical protein